MEKARIKKRYFCRNRLLTKEIQLRKSRKERNDS